MKKTFDAVAWMRTRREEIDCEEEGLSWEERWKRTLETLKDDPLYRRLRARAIRGGNQSTPRSDSAGDRPA
jgi:hypothetical protein